MEAHIPALAAIGCEESIWHLMLYGMIRTEEDMRVWVQGILRRQAAGTDLPFAVIHLASGRVAGATRYMEMCPEHKGLEIGGTWYAPEFQRTAVNTECKYLLLRQAFEVLRAIRVQFKTDTRNERSWRALERIGAKREGVLRNHYILQDGTVRDSVYYSIIKQEWPGVKARLEERLASGSKVVVSGDKHLLKVSGYQEVEVLKPREFLNK
jgi:N-acetyltransferase